MVRRRAGLRRDRRRGDDPRADRRRRSPSSSPDEDDRRWVEPALLTLLGLEPAPAGGRDVLFAAWRIFFERVAERRHRPSCSSRTSSGPTRACSTSSTTCSSGRGPAPISSSPWPGRSSSSGGRTGAPATRNLTRLALEPLTDDAMRELLAGFVPGLPERRGQGDPRPGPTGCRCTPSRRSDRSSPMAASHAMATPIGPVGDARRAGGPGDADAR